MLSFRVLLHMALQIIPTTTLESRYDFAPQFLLDREPLRVHGTVSDWFLPGLVHSGPLICGVAMWT
jgi:hypothetical protein